MQAVGVSMHDVGDKSLMLDDMEMADLLASGELRLEFPHAVMRFAVVGTVVLSVLFEM